MIFFLYFILKTRDMKSGKMLKMQFVYIHSYFGLQNDDDGAKLMECERCAGLFFLIEKRYRVEHSTLNASAFG